LNLVDFKDTNFEIEKANFEIKRNT